MSRREREGGFVLLWFALSIVLLLGLAAFVVDLMHGYSQAQKVQNSADAGALAGVVYMPGHDADAAALAESVVRNNVEDPAADVDVWTDTQCDPDCLPNQIQVEVRASYPTYFAKIFGSRFDAVSVRKKATAEYDPPVVLGSPDNTFGNMPDCTACTQPQFWASVAGPDAAKGGGNAALSDYCEYKDPTTQLQSGIASVPSVADNCPPGSNNHSEDTEEAQYFVIDKQSGSAGNLRVDLYDPAWINTVSSTSPCGSDATKAVWQMFESSSPTSLRRPSSPPGPGGLPPADIPVSCSGDQLSRHRHGGDALFNASLPDNFSPDRPPEYCAWVTGQNVPDGVLSAGEPCEPEKNAPWGPLGPETNSFPTAIPPDPNYKGDGRINNLFRQYLLDTRDTSGVTTTNPRLSLSGATTYELYPPDDTPTNPYDNEDHASAACADSYNGHANPWLAHEAKVNGIDTSYDTYHAWTRLLCSGGTSADGRWVLKVYGTPGSIAVNSFAIAASSNGARDGGSDPMVSVNAVDRLATYTNKPTASGDFYLARVVPSSVPRTLRLTLFDTGDFNCPTDTGANCPNTAEVQIQIKPANDDPLNPFKTTAGPDPGAPQLNELDGCQYTQPAADDWHNGLTAPWEIGTKDYGTLGDTEDDCKILHVKRKEWNGRYVMVEIPIPDNSGYYCDASEVRSCWLKIYYTSNDGTMAITDVSTWVATFSGNPVRIVK